MILSIGDWVGVTPLGIKWWHSKIARSGVFCVEAAEAVMLSWSLFCWTAWYTCTHLYGEDDGVVICWCTQMQLESHMYYWHTCTVTMTALWCAGVHRCRRYSYVDMSAMSSARTSDGFSADRDRTQLYRDSEILQGLGKTDMAHLNRRQVSHTTVG